MGAVKEQIDEMLKMYGNTGASEELEEVQDIEEQPTEEPQQDEESVEETTVEEETSEEVKVSDDVPDQPEPDNELVKLRSEHEELKSKLNEILSRKPVESPQIVDEPIEEQDFVSNEDVEEILNDPKAFNKILNKVFLKGVELSRKEAIKKSMELQRELPHTIKTNIVTIEHLRRASEKFYKDNSDLAPFKKVVGTVFDEVSAEHPDWDYDKLLTTSEVETRKRLNLPKPTKDSSEDKKDVPKLPRKKSQPRPVTSAKESDPLLSDIDAMTDSLNRR